MTLQEQTETVVEQTIAQVLAALAAYAAGTLTYDAVAGIVAAYVAAGTSGAAALGDVALAAAVTVQTGQVAAPLGITRPATEPDRLAQATRTVLDDLDLTAADEDLQEALRAAETRLIRLTAAEIRKATADAYDAAVKASDAVTGWTRGLEPQACQLCRWWWREGRVWNADHPFQRHKGCDCSQLIVTTERKTA